MSLPLCTAPKVGNEHTLSLLSSVVETRPTRGYMALAHVRAGPREKALEIVHKVEREPRPDFAALVLLMVHGFLKRRGRGAKNLGEAV